MSFKPYKSYSYKPYANQTARWDHGGFEQLEREERSQRDFGYQNRRKKHFTYEQTSGKLYDNEKSKSHTLTDVAIQDEKQKQVELQQKAEPYTKHYIEKKRPDRVLYKPPKQRDQQKEVVLQRNSSTISETPKSDQAEQMDSFLKNTADLTSIEAQDEERYSVTSESTNNSDKTQNEEIALSKCEQRNSSLLSPGDLSLQEKSFVSQPLFELTVTLYDGTIAELKIFDSAEEDYEAIIDEFCSFYQIEEEDCLPIKIQIVKYMLCENALDTNRLNALFGKLLEANYELLTKGNCSASALLDDENARV